MGEKKVVNRNIAIALGLLCIILSASTAGIAFYSGNTDNNYVASHTHTNSEYAALSARLATANENISSLNTQLSALESKVANNSSNQTTTDLYPRIDALY